MVIPNIPKKLNDYSRATKNNVSHIKEKRTHAMTSGKLIISVLLSGCFFVIASE